MHTKKRVKRRNPKHTIARKLRAKQRIRFGRERSDPMNDAADLMAAALLGLGEASNWVQIVTPDGVTVVAAAEDAGEALQKWVGKKFGAGRPC